MPQNAQTDALAAMAQKIYGELGKTLKLEGSGGAADSSSRGRRVQAGARRARHHRRQRPHRSRIRRDRQHGAAVLPAHPDGDGTRRQALSAVRTAFRRARAAAEYARQCSVGVSWRASARFAGGFQEPPGLFQYMTFASSAAKVPVVALPVDGRQSETALKIARGTARLLHLHGFCVVSELPLASGRRADLVALSAATATSGSSRSSRRSRISAPTRSGWTTGCTATGCSSPPRSRCPAKSSRRTPG